MTNLIYLMHLRSQQLGKRPFLLLKFKKIKETNILKTIINSIKYLMVSLKVKKKTHNETVFYENDIYSFDI